MEVQAYRVDKSPEVEKALAALAEVRHVVHAKSIKPLKVNNFLYSSNHQ